MFEHVDEMLEIRNQMKKLAERKKELGESAIEYAKQYIEEAKRFVPNAELARATGTAPHIWSSSLRQVNNEDFPSNNYRYKRQREITGYYIACDANGTPLPGARPGPRKTMVYGWVYMNKRKEA